MEDPLLPPCRAEGTGDVSKAAPPSSAPSSLSRGSAFSAPFNMNPGIRACSPSSNSSHVITSLPSLSKAAKILLGSESYPMLRSRDLQSSPVMTHPSFLNSSHALSMVPNRATKNCTNLTTSLSTSAALIPRVECREDGRDWLLTAVAKSFAIVMESALRGLSCLALGCTSEPKNAVSNGARLSVSRSLQRFRRCSDAPFFSFFRFPGLVTGVVSTVKALAFAALCLCFLL
mmetsp:Transcript_41184/g.74420  ORF Transcript_41184/g.74420 Transcript_41184/m.74420 type:complete len:231 (+) Transcript_41184:297-989(+)